MTRGIKINISDIVGSKIGRLTVIGEGVKKEGRNKTRFIVRCDCGKEFSLEAYTFLSGHTKSCGCYRRDATIQNHTTHNLKGHPLYTIWSNIKGRCYTETNKAYYNYGAKGVRMCDEWVNDFESFYKWSLDNGWVKGLHIDKDIIPKKLGIKPILYSPSMCSVVDRKNNNYVTSQTVFVEYMGEEYCLKELTDKLGLKYKRVHERLLRGWTLEDAISLPNQNFNNLN